MKRPHLLATTVAAATLFAASVVASPWWELRRLHAAVASHDAAAVSEHVDFPALRASVKGQIGAVLGKELGRGDANPLAALGQAMAMAFVDPMVDALVSPAGVIAMMENGRVSMARREAPREAAPGQARAGGATPDYALAYRGWDRVDLRWKGPEGGSFIFRRDGLWGWKLAGIDMGSRR